MIPYTPHMRLSRTLWLLTAVSLAACTAWQKPIKFYACDNCPRPYFCNTNSGHCEAPDAPKHRWGTEFPQ